MMLQERCTSTIWKIQPRTVLIYQCPVTYLTIALGWEEYHKIPKISPGAYSFERPFLRGLCTEGNLHLKSIGLTFFLEGNLPFFFVLLCIWQKFPSTTPPPAGAYIWRGDLREGFLRYEFGGLKFRGAYFGHFSVTTWILSNDWYNKKTMQFSFS